jgi:N-acetylglucosaminyldiphosphoundecaprenol N-acetyl-beta-D-mannosaminyltransferase
MATKSQFDILGIRIDNLSKKEVLQKIKSFLKSANFHQIVTINPEIILQAKNNTDYKKILNNTSLNIADGIGVKFAFLRYGQKLKARYSGVDLMWNILEIADKSNYKVCLIASKKGLSTWEQTRDAILEKFPNLKIVGKNINYDKGEISNQVQNEINKSDIVFVNFGAPLQEIFLNRLSKAGSRAKLGIGVGGAFDYISGAVPRAPLWMRQIGLEWLFRLFQQPHRAKRIFNAVVVFPIKVLFCVK